MRYAALTFGILAGLVASFILALGGLDAATIFHADRPMQLASFALYIIANLGVLGAGLVLAIPLVGAGLFLAGALGWVGAALFLRHGPDFVMLTPPGLLLVAFAFSLVAHLRRPRLAAHEGIELEEDQDDEPEDEEEEEEPAPPPRQQRRAPVAPDPEDFEELPPVTVGAGFFGQGGTAMPLQPEQAPRAPHPQFRQAQPQQRQAQPQPQARPQPAPPPQPQQQPQAALRVAADPQVRSSDNPDDWRPGRRRPPPPRATPMFRQPEDLEEEEYEDEGEESGFGRFARLAASVLSFALYAGLAGAAVLVFWNARNEIGHPTVSKVDSKAVAEISSSAPPPEPSSAALPASSDELASVAVADAKDASAVSEFPARDAGLTLLQQPTTADSTAASSVAAAEEPPASAEPAAEEPPVTPTVGPMMPDSMPAGMAAERLKPAPRPTPPEPNVDTPLALDTTGL